MRTSVVFCVLVSCVAIGICMPGWRAFSASKETSVAQDTIYLDRRISSLEMRLNSIESSLRNLEQQAMTSQRSLPGQTGRDPEVTLIRNELELLKGQVRVAECGVMHLDERTLTPAAKASRGANSQESKDPCRVNPESPLQFLKR